MCARVCVCVCVCVWCVCVCEWEIFFDWEIFLLRIHPDKTIWDVEETVTWPHDPTSQVFRRLETAFSSLASLCKPVVPRVSSGGTSGKEPACQCRRPKRSGFELWVRKTPRGRSGNPLRYSCLENPMDRGTLAGYSP